MPNRDLKVTLLGDDKTSGAFKSASGNTESFGKKLSEVGKFAAVGFAGGLVAAGGGAIKLGMDFQESMTSLVTGAGESQKNIGLVSDGILNMAGKVGISASQLASGMYLIESAGYHSGAGLNVLEAAAEGARVGAAQMTDVANGLTTALTDYHIPASQAAAVTSALVQTVADGKTHLGDLANSLGNVMPLASQLGVKFQDVAGGLAAMTTQGMTADNASQNLNHLISSLGADTMPKAAKAIAAVGLSAQQLNDGLRNKGLPATLQMVEDAVGKKFPAGSAKYMDALRKILGGQPGLDAALMLSGKNMDAYKANVENIGEKLQSSAKHVEGFADTQKDLKTKLENAKAGVEAMATKLGLALIPAVTAVMGKLASFGSWLVAHKPVLITFAAVIGTVLVTAITAYVASLVSAAASSVASFAVMIAKGVAWVASTAASFVAATGRMVAFGAASVANGAIAAGAWVAAQARTVASLVATAAGFVAQGAVMAASMAGTVIRVVAGWVLMGVQSLIQAARMAAAWVIAMGPVGWVIALVVGLVALIIANWSKVKQWTGAAWEWVTSKIGAAWNWITGKVSGAVSAVVGAVSGAWNWVTSHTASAWHTVVSAIGNGITDAVHWVASLPGRILGALGNLGSLLWNAGKSMIQGLINGAGSLLRNIGSFFLNLLPGWIVGPFKWALGIKSPSKVFAGFGKNIGHGLIQGMSSMQPAVAAQMQALANTQGLAGLGANGTGRVMTPTVALGGMSGSASGYGSVPTVHIEHYNEAKQSPREIAESLTFMARTR